MVPKLTAQGRSFKGAASYYLHDKREEGEAVRLSGERVAWTETINLPTTDPERAWRMMAYTAMAQAELKEAAGQAVTGKKLTKPVLAYSLSWHPDEQPTKADQLEAAQATLKVLGLEGHQAVIVCHNDEPQAHVHIIVNRVNPETGLANTGSFSQRKLQAWALDYERERGKIFCPKREENAERRAQGEKVYAPDTPRPVFEFNRATGNDNLTADFVQTEQKQKDAHLLSMGRTLKESHARQWADLKRIYAASKGKIFDHADQVKQQKLSLMNGENKLRWGDLFRKQRLERVAFEAMEEGTLSKLWNMASAIRELRQQDTEGHLLGQSMPFCPAVSAAPSWQPSRSGSGPDWAGRSKLKSRRPTGESTSRPPGTLKSCAMPIWASANTCGRHRISRRPTCAPPGRAATPNGRLLWHRSGAIGRQPGRNSPPRNRPCNSLRPANGPVNGSGNANRHHRNPARV